jgi:hypothetical protein
MKLIDIKFIGLVNTVSKAKNSHFCQTNKNMLEKKIVIMIQ